MSCNASGVSALFGQYTSSKIDDSVIVDRREEPVTLAARAASILGVGPIATRLQGAIENPKSEIQNTESESGGLLTGCSLGPRGSESEIRNPKYGILGPWGGDSQSGLRIRNPKYRIQNPRRGGGESLQPGAQGLRIQNPRFERSTRGAALDSERVTLDFEPLRIQNSEFGLAAPGASLDSETPDLAASHLLYT